MFERALDHLPVTKELPLSRPDASVRHVKLAVAQKSIDAYNRRDLFALRALNDERVELDWSAARGLTAGIYRGRDAVLRFFSDFFATFESITIEPQCFIVTDGSILIPNVARVRGRDGIEAVARSTVALTVNRSTISLIRLCHEPQAGSIDAPLPPDGR